MVNKVHPELPQTTRKDKVKRFMAEHHLTYRKLGTILGLTGAGVRKSLLSETVTLERIEDFKRIGFPENLLPIPK